MNFSTADKLFWACALVTAGALAGCIDEPTTPAVFDVVYEETTFDNKLFTPVEIYRNDTLIDTLDARSKRTYPIGKRGVFTHAWRIIAPRDGSGRTLGIEPRYNLQVQYPVRETYELDEDPVTGTSIFTPRVLNASPYIVRIQANVDEDDEFLNGPQLQPNQNTSLTHAPYYYWHTSSNIIVSGGSRYVEVDRDDTIEGRRLQLDDSYQYDGSGLTEPILVY